MTTERRAEIDRGVAILTSRGVCWAAWAGERGYSLNVVHGVRKGRLKCSRGESHRVAEALRAVAAESPAGTAPTRPVIFPDRRALRNWIGRHLPGEAPAERPPMPFRLLAGPWRAPETAGSVLAAMRGSPDA